MEDIKLDFHFTITSCIQISAVKNLFSFDLIDTLNKYAYARKVYILYTKRLYCYYYYTCRSKCQSMSLNIN